MGHDKLFQKRKMQKLYRKENTRDIRRILIVCEGKKTEPNYFKKFPVNPVVFDDITIEGTGYNTISLIKFSIKIRNEALKNGKPYIETWCVFDKDDFPIEDFNYALHFAQNNQIKCAYSIEAFEIWYMLHYNFYDTAMPRQQYKEKLTELIKKPYIKNDENMYSVLQKRQAKAIQNAKTLYYKQYSQPLQQQNPVTTVFQLVERLTEQ
jgi:hypothetical protein